MELRQLRYFIAVCTAGSVAGAAKVLHIAQPALSRQMAALEDEFGARLLVRLPRGVALTRAGEALLVHARLLLAGTASLRAQVGLAAKGKAGSLRVGIIPGYGWLPALGHAIAELSRESPDASVMVKSGLSAWQLEAVKRHELDAGIVAWRSPLDAEVEGVKVYEDRMVLAMPAATARGLGKIRALGDLAGQKFILFPRQDSPSHYDALARILKAANIPTGQPGTAAAADIPTIIGLVSAGLGCAIVPSSYKYHCPAGVVLKEVGGLDLKFDLELVWRADSRDPLLHSFVGMLPASQGMLR
ncbi:MAG TPA: LysR family transcriptional regulator [Bordetella sp.]|uniref:LysR family transcriptional regulator n=1 Tax=Bordetella sp. TaxID=28081 RepID=UPI002ED3F740